MDEVLKVFKARVMDAVTDRQVQFILFGSRGRKDHGETSDYGLLIISGKKNEIIVNQIKDIETDLFVQTSKIINSHIFTPEELEELKFEPFIINALKEGITYN